jgi:16S rRNA (cytidine1402-2'-O)-methyltransferase
MPGHGWRSVSAVGERGSWQWYNNQPVADTFPPFSLMSGTLFVVATPIGNLEDITLRALRVLHEAQLIAAEDTRHTAKLLQHHGISTPTISFHQHNTRTRIPELTARLAAGDHIALVSDAGTPGVSDPGIELVQACIEQQLTVDPIPGVSAPLTAAVASGFPLAPLTIFGFAPAGAKDRIEWLVAAAKLDHAWTFFEAPHRIQRTLADMASILGERPIMVGRELTKLHQQFIRGDAAQIAGKLGEPRGEFTVVVSSRGAQADGPIAASDEDVAILFGDLTNSAGYSRRDAIAAVALRYGWSGKAVYAAVERAKSSGS